MTPGLGVTPPSARQLHSSMRSAPPRSEAIADSIESTQTSSFVWSGMDSSLLAEMSGLQLHEEDCAAGPVGESRAKPRTCVTTGGGRGFEIPVVIDNA